jgi:hypothetical protein
VTKYSQLNKTVSAAFSLIAIIALGQKAQGKALVLKQKLKFTVNNQTFDEKHTWFIEGKKFRLDSKIKGRISSFIFNNRNLFACIKADNNETASKMSVNSNNKNLIERFIKGVCIPVPINVATSFLISPHNTVNALDVTESLELRIKLKRYKSLIPKIKGPTLSNGNCKIRNRKYELNYYSYNSKKYLKNSVSESYCQDDSINWRSGLWRQLSRIMLQQKSGPVFRKQLQKHKIPSLGFALEKTGQYAVFDGKKKIYNSSVQLGTTSRTTTPSNPKMFALPSGFEVISTTKSKVASNAKKPKVQQQDDVVEQEESQLIPAILRTFLGMPF